MSESWKASLSAIVRANNARKHNGTTASAATRDKRIDVLFAGFALLRELGYRLDDVRSFKGKHMRALAEAWEGRRLSASTLQNRVSIFRQFSVWIGKLGMVEASESYVRDALSVRRTTINKVDKSWTPRGISIPEKIEEVRKLDARIAIAMELQAAFALRVRESCVLCPHLADLGQVLDVRRGTKNGRPRTVRIETAYQREVLEKSKAMVSSPVESISDPGLTLKQVLSRYYRIVRSVGITRNDGITSHGLRHEAANDYYREQAGHASPVRGGPAPIDATSELAARLKTSELLGHGREDATTHYLGRHVRGASSSTRPQSDAT